MKKLWVALAFVIIAAAVWVLPLRRAADPKAATAPGTPHTVSFRKPAAQTAGARGRFHLDGVDTETILRYFNEVAFGAELGRGRGDARLWRWEQPIRYCLHGSYTLDDAEYVAHIFDLLRGIPGFPGAEEVDSAAGATMQLYFCSREGMHKIMDPKLIDPAGDRSEQERTRTEIDTADGVNCVDADPSYQVLKYKGCAIGAATICYREDMDPQKRRSVLAEEIINAAGLCNDTKEREGSVIYQYGSEIEEPDDVDQMLLQLLYAPEMRAGLNEREAAEVIRRIYS